jgi:hypothetical protein
MAEDVNAVKSDTNEDKPLIRVKLIMDKRIDLAIAIASILIGVFILVETRNIRAGFTDDPITSRGLPVAGGILFIILGAVLTLTRLLTWSRFPGNFIPMEGKEDDEGHPASWIRAWVVIVAAWLSTWAMQPLGYLFAMWFFLLIFLLDMGVRSLKMLVAFPVIFTLLTWYIFSQPLNVILPMGPLTTFARSLGLTP